MPDNALRKVNDKKTVKRAKNGEGLLSRIAQSFIFRLLISLILAVFVWLLLNAAVINPPGESYTTVNLRVLNRPSLDGKNLELGEEIEIPGTITVYDKGREEDRNNISRGNFEAVIDFANIMGVDTKSLPVILNETNTENVTVVRIEPSEIEIEVERRVTKPFNIDVIFTGDTADGFIRTGFTQYPTTRTYSDRESEIEKIDRVEAIVDISELAGNTVFHPMCVIYDHDGNEINRAGWEQAVDVTVEVSKEVPVIPNVIGTPATDYYELIRTATPETVRINGPREMLEKVDNLYTEPVNINGARDTVKHEMPLVLPNTVKMSMSDRASAEVEVAIYKYQYTQDIALNKSHVEFINTNSNLRYEIVESEKLLTLKGRIEDIASLSPDKVSAVVNVAGIYPGTHAVPAIVTLPDRIINVHDVILTVVVASAYGGRGTGNSGDGNGSEAVTTTAISSGTSTMTPLEAEPPDESGSTDPDFTDPIEPSVPSETSPSETSEPRDPSDTSSSADSSEITDTRTPAELTEPTESTETTEPTGLTEPTGSTEQTEPTGITEPTEVTESSDTSANDETVREEGNIQQGDG
jgi:YbbR domain-containing protein